MDESNSCMMVESISWLIIRCGKLCFAMPCANLSSRRTFTTLLLFLAQAKE